MVRSSARLGGRAALSALAVAAAAGTAWAQPGEKPRHSAPLTGVVPVMVFEYAGVRALLADPRDAGLGRALDLVPTRIRELPGDLPDMPPAVATGVNFALDLLMRPTRLGVIFNADNPTGGAWGYGVSVSFAAEDKTDAEQIQANVGLVLANLPVRRGIKPSGRIAGMQDLQTPFGLLTWGPRETPSGWRYELLFGSVDDPDAALSALPAAPDDMTVIARGHADFRGTSPLVDMGRMMMGAGSPEFEEGMAELTRYGLTGDDAVRIDYVGGAAGDVSVDRFSFSNMAERATEYMITRTPLGADALRLVPADAVAASLTFVDFSFFSEVLAEMEAEGLDAERALAEFTKITGVDLREDVLKSLGPTMAAYVSESTGGGGVGSLVAAIAMPSAEARERLMSAHSKLSAMANTAFESSAEVAGRVRLNAWVHEGISLMSLNFPGLPVPFEPTYTFTKDWLILGLTPQAAIAGALQATGKGDKGLASAPGFTAMMPGGERGLKKATSVFYMNTAELARDGYSMASWLGSALGNAVRSPTDAQRSAGMIVPTLPELLKSARPTVAATYWDGDTYVYEVRGERSITLSVARAGGILGAVAPWVAGPAAGVFGNSDIQDRLEDLGSRRTLGALPALALRPEGPAIIGLIQMAGAAPGK